MNYKNSPLIISFINNYLYLCCQQNNRPNGKLKDYNSIIYCFTTIFLFTQKRNRNIILTCRYTHRRISRQCTPVIGLITGRNRRTFRQRMRTLCVITCTCHGQVQALFATLRLTAECSIRLL